MTTIREGFIDDRYEGLPRDRRTFEGVSSIPLANLRPGRSNPALAYDELTVSTTIWNVGRASSGEFDVKANILLWEGGRVTLEAEYPGLAPGEGRRVELGPV